MNKKLSNLTVWVVLSSFVLGSVFMAATWRMNQWPSDTEVYFFDAARKIPTHTYLSQMHAGFDQERVRWLHGKEIFILAGFVMQYLMNDFETLRPFVFICIWATLLSALLIFCILKEYWDERAALVGYGIFVTSFWPYMYILFAKHQPLGLFFFLLAVASLFQAAQPKKALFYYFCSGLFMCLALFASSVSTLYIPYYGAAVLFHIRKKSLPEIVRGAGPALLGFILVFLYINAPNVAANVKEFMEYVRISGQYNHFFYNQRILQQWFPAHTLTTRGGWEWIFKYAFLMMPVLFPMFLASNVYLICKRFKSKQKIVPALLIIFLGWLSPILAEVRQVAQYGANYFSWFPGIILLVSYALYVFIKEDWEKLGKNLRRLFQPAVCLILAGHIGYNAYMFFTDIYPTRMVTTYISDKLRGLNLEKYLFTYAEWNPHTYFITEQLDPGLLKERNIALVTIQHLPQVEDGYILLAPIGGDSIYNAATSFYLDFDRDVYLNELRRKGNLKDYVVASYRTMASSRIWPHEEEILSYRYLILGHFSPEVIEKGKALILDGKKLRNDILKNLPSKEYLFMEEKGIRNIGTKHRTYVFRGYEGEIKNPMDLKKVAFRIYKVGDPKDELKAYIYRVDERQDMWVPQSKDFQSRPVSGEKMSTSPEGSVVLFNFEKTLDIISGQYFFIVYRTGPPDDDNYYRIFKDYIGSLKE